MDEKNYSPIMDIGERTFEGQLEDEKNKARLPKISSSERYSDVDQLIGVLLCWMRCLVRSSGLLWGMGDHGEVLGWQ